MATTIIYGDDKLNANIKSIALPTALTASDSGKVIILNGATGKAITLPAVTTAGFKVRIQTGTLFATTNWTITSPTAVIQGGAIVNSVFVPCASKAIISLAFGADTLGDWIEIVSDGSLYYVNGVGALATSIAFS